MDKSSTRSIIAYSYFTFSTHSSFFLLPPALPPSLPLSLPSTSTQQYTRSQTPFLQLLPQRLLLPSLLLFFVLLHVQVFLNKFGDGLGRPLGNAEGGREGGRQGGEARQSSENYKKDMVLKKAIEGHLPVNLRKGEAWWELKEGECVEEGRRDEGKEGRRNEHKQTYLTISPGVVWSSEKSWRLGRTPCRNWLVREGGRKRGGEGRRGRRGGR